jgi:hypothetical protein
MAAINFPSTPSVGDTFTANDIYFKWDGVKWNAQSTVVVNWVKKTSNYTAQNADRILADTSGGSFTITLPLIPSEGATILIADGGDWAVNNLTVARNGNTIEGASENLILDITGIRVDLIYSGTTWEVYDFIGPSELPDQTGNTGKYLSTDGTNSSWEAIDALPDQTGNTGKYLSTDGTNSSWEAIDLNIDNLLPTQTGNTGKYLSTDGTNSSWETVVPSVEKTADTGSAAVPSGTEAQRDASPTAGYFRFNIDLGKFEGYNGTSWGSVGGGGATGGAADEVFIQNDQIVTANYTIPAGKNAMSTGPIAIDTGVAVTVSSGSRWVVI